MRRAKPTSDLDTRANRATSPRRCTNRKLVQVDVRRGGLAPMLVQGIVSKRGRGYVVEAWRAFDVSGGGRFPCGYTLSQGVEQYLIGLLKRSS